jgi:hypothetical protein
MRKHTRPGDVFSEPFSGSGSQIIAAEQEGRHCRAIELEPVFVDVAAQRWEKFSAKRPAQSSEQRVVVHSRARRILFMSLAASVVGAGIALLLWSPWSQRGEDSSYDTSVAEPHLVERRPKIVFDEGHNNVHALSGRFAPFARLLRSDGCQVSVIRSRFTATALAGADVLVIVNASGPEGTRESAAFTESEIAVVKNWVAAGGALLLAADHHPYGVAAAPLGRAFSVEMVGGWCEDQANALQGTADPGAIVFAKAKGLLGDHPIVNSTPLSVVATFTGQSLAPPAAATPLLICAPSAVDRIPVASKTVASGGRRITTFETTDASAAGHCQGLAMPFGKGRVVVLGEAAMLSAQIDGKSGLRYGMNVPGVDNRQFVLNAVRWLAGALE